MLCRQEKCTKEIRNLQTHNIKQKKSKLKLSGMVSIQNLLVIIYNSYKIETKTISKNKQTNNQNLCEEKKVNVDKQEWTYPVCKCQVFNTWYEIFTWKSRLREYFIAVSWYLYLGFSKEFFMSDLVLNVCFLSVIYYYLCCFISQISDTC